VCDFGTVSVDDLMVVERYSHVMHIVSHVRGRLRPGMNCYDALRACFRELREARDALRPKLPNQPLTELSMGMTDDFGAAIAEGSTMIRVGRALFGRRPPAASAVPAPPPMDSPC